MYYLLLLYYYILYIYIYIYLFIYIYINCTCYYFKDVIRFWDRDIDFNDILLDEKL